jgi:hypothetical protein
MIISGAGSASTVEAREVQIVSERFDQFTFGLVGADQVQLEPAAALQIADADRSFRTHLRVVNIEIAEAIYSYVTRKQGVCRTTFSYPETDRRLVGRHDHQKF